MQRGRAKIIERSVERAAAAALAASCGFASWAGLAASGLRLPISCLVVAIAYGATARLLARIDAAPRFPLPIFDIASAPATEAMDELILTEADRLDAIAAGADVEPLLLDDVLAELRPDSRVVRLFDPARMPTPGQLDARIRQHLAAPPAAAAPPDASEALHEALAELRRSLR